MRYGMRLRVGYELIYDCPQPTPMMLMLHIHHTRAADLIVPDRMIAEPAIPISPYRDSFGNWCTRIIAPAGRLRLTSTAVVRDSGEADAMPFAQQQHPVEDLPEDAMV